MQLFRSQLSRFIPHPHRDSWMRNNLDKWLKLLRLCASFTLLSFAAFILVYPAEIQEICKSYLPGANAENSLIIVQSIAGLLILGGLLSWRCGRKPRVWSTLVVWIAGALLLGIMSMLSISSGGFILLQLNSLVITTPFLLLCYKSLQNKVDHWSIYASIALSLALIGQSLYGSNDYLPTHNYLYLSLTKAGLTEDAANNLLQISGYVNYGFIVALFIPALRRLSLYVMIAWGISTAIAPLFVTIGTCDLSLGIILFFMRSAQWMIPLLILLTLASQKKTATLRL